MNIEKFTQNAQGAVVDCQNIAISMGHQTLDGEHLHLALLQQRDGLIGKLLAYMNVNVQAIASDVQAELDKLPRVSGGAADGFYNGANGQRRQTSGACGTGDRSGTPGRKRLYRGF